MFRPPVRAAFIDALEAWRSAQEDSINDPAYISRFASMARTLTNPEEVSRALDNQAVKEFYRCLRGRPTHRSW
jgi:hypothetical protein